MNFDAAITKFLLFLHLNPGMGLFVLAVAITMGRKWMKHKKGDARITWSNLRKYPGEALEFFMVALALILSLYFFIAG